MKDDRDVIDETESGAQDRDPHDSASLPPGPEVYLVSFALLIFVLTRLKFCY